MAVLLRRGNGKTHREGAKSAKREEKSDDYSSSADLAPCGGFQPRSKSVPNPIASLFPSRSWRLCGEACRNSSRGSNVATGARPTSVAGQRGGSPAMNRGAVNPTAPRVPPGKARGKPAGGA
jgi:hypothetical protein